jgi:hypothetical protein
MTTWTRSSLLDLWERGISRHPLDRALLLAAWGGEDRSLDELADEPLAMRDQRLLQVLVQNVGHQIAAWVDCPDCATRLEFSLDARSLVGEAGRSDLAIDGARVRRPTSRDVAVALAEPNAESQARRLAERCLEPDGRAEAPVAVTDEVMAQVEQALAGAESAGDLQLDFTCEACGHTWQDVFDIGSYLWREVDARARQLMRDVDVLARAYGWTEPEVLALSDARRAAYVELATA